MRGAGHIRQGKKGMGCFCGAAASREGRQGRADDAK